MQMHAARISNNMMQNMVCECAARLARNMQLPLEQQRSLLQPILDRLASDVTLRVVRGVAAYAY